MIQSGGKIYSEPGMSEATTENNIDKIDLRRAFGSFATGVTIVTTLDEQSQPCGFTANSFSSVSLEPPLVLVSIAKSAFGLTIFSESKGFAINILAEHQRDLSNRFASKGTDKFSGVDWQSGSTGAPLLNTVVAWFDCQNFQQIDAGDHVILIGKVLDYSYSTDAPLGFCRGAYVSFGLSLKMLELVSSTGRLQVGALIENEGKILLQTDVHTGEVKIPVAASVGDTSQSDSLLGHLAEAGIEAKLPFLFAAYSSLDTRFIYYRGELKSISQVTQTKQLHFYGYDEIPWGAVQCDANEYMIKRFFREREVDDFGVYIGDYSRGDVYPLPSGG
jgi:flavin reductase (DIM6/NTAB) family NADH-FMN oxidoreductase RutF